MLFRNLFGGLFALCLAAGATHAQQVGVNTPTPHPSAVLEVQSTERGLLPPRLTQAQRDAIAAPAEGLTIYNLDTHCMEFWNGTAWISTCATTAPCVPPPASTPAANTPVCAGSTLNLTATPVPGATYVWSGPNAFSSTAQNPSIANVSAANAGVYRLRTWALGCYSDEMTVTVTVVPNPYTARAAFPGVVRGSYTRFTDGTHIYAGGGLTAWCAGFQNTFYRYTPATDTWAAMANIPTNHAGGGSMGNPTTGYAVGGSMNCAGTGGTVTRYNIGANTWTTGLPAVPTPVHGSSASHTATGDTLYVFGGKTADGTTCGEYTPSLRMYRPSLNTWTTLAPLPADGRGWPVIVEINGRVFAGLGTKWTGCPTNYTDWWEYAPATNTWTARAAYPGPGGAKYGYFALGGYIYVADPNFQMYRYDPAANTWATLPCPIPISTDAALVVGTSAYLFDIDNTRQVWQFTP